MESNTYQIEFSSYVNWGDYDTVSAHELVVLDRVQQAAVVGP